MPRATLPVAEVLRRYGDAFRAQVGTVLSTAQHRELTAIEQCRTATLGGHVEQCDHCGHRRVWYNSCRKPALSALPLVAGPPPSGSNGAAQTCCPPSNFTSSSLYPRPPPRPPVRNKAVVYGLLFRAVADTLRTIDADPRHLGAEVGFFAVPHTWGQTLGCCLRFCIFSSKIQA